VSARVDREALRRRVLADLVGERTRQDAKWGEQNHDAATWLAILTEEVGEAAQAILHDTFGGRAAGSLRTELVQVAAVTVQWIECIDRLGIAPDDEGGGDVR
jgi:NTP pyrophosphatase (non-canonical NTP hydrolase)